MNRSNILGTPAGRRLGGTCLAMCLAIPGALAASGPPSAAAFRSAFEAEFLKADANGPALELESLAASLGIDLAPKDAPERTRPTEELEAAYVAPGGYLDTQLSGSDERITPPRRPSPGFSPSMPVRWRRSSRCSCAASRGGRST